MRIVTAPHPALRETTKKVKRADPKLASFLEQLGKTLTEKNDPPGVGLAAPQVDKAWRIFATNLHPSKPESKQNGILRYFINPVMVKHAAKMSFGPDEKHPALEGCLSIPSLWGPVPRYEWADFEWQELQDDKLVEAKGRFSHFAARVMQHELDHLNGILFTDYSLEYDLPVYQEEKPNGDKLSELKDRSILEVF